MTLNDPTLLKYYASRAPEYEQIYYRDAPQRRRELDDEAKRLTRLVGGCTVLDLACGTGYWLERMAQTARSITAVDISSEMIHEARRKTLACPVEFIQADMYHLPLSADAYDRVTLGFWLSHHPRQLYGQLFTLLLTFLKEDGLIWMIDNNPPAEGLTHNSVGRDEHGNNLIKRKLLSGEEFVIIKNYFERDGLKALFEGEFRIERLTYGECYWSVVLKPL
jgi:ubiquinone/menaquinone biosynthesis C-methylase UbiE